ncbi:gamma-glutamyl-gamma-aminobutyrate hydrolase family protein [Brevibacillus daliensis]|uniref:gamma-glutamyl-gamma-aminobutyrate hydrolase family protein n=1 Tax=Brevibacillus daliensis TaxID=2892995 RepID=UPI001E3017ED|nr:gamma-glutamyl-gamma-aminobutyrate hydrolase family protein [Brevibacillus daliensis]
MKPVIGIAGPRMFLPDVHVEHYYYVSNGFVEGVMKSGGLPVMIPLLHQDQYPIPDILDAVDALIFTGGVDPAPHLYHEAPHPELGEVDAERDQAELRLIQAARERNLPMFGVCRGAQILAVALGGSLVQDIASQIPGAIGHRQKGTIQYASHEVVLQPGFIQSALGTDKILVNSTHHQSVKDLPEGYRVTAIAPDGVVEGFESEDGRIIGVQWHPERMWVREEQMLGLLKAFVSEVASSSVKV